MKKINTFWLNYLRPNLFVRDIYKINLNSLKNSGIKLIICDLDNTLVPHFSKFPNKYASDFLNKVNNSGIDIVIASNNTKKRVQTFCEKLSENIEIKKYFYNSKKPFSKKIKNFILENGYSYEDVLFIGDQFITDIFMANRLQSRSILVLPLVDQSRTISVNMFFRIIEKYIYKKLTHENILNQDYLYVDKIEDEYELL